MSTIEYRKSRPEDRAAILGILDEDKAQAEIDARARTFDWQFGANTPQDDRTGAFWIVTVDGEIAGVNGLMPVKVRYRQQPVEAVWSCDTAVSPRFRGKGLGKGLVVNVSAEAEVVLGYGISDMSDPILDKQGWDLGRDVKGFFFHVAETGAKGMLKNTRSGLMRLALGLSKRDAMEIEIRDRDVFGADVDNLWQASVDGYTSVVERDAAYLNSHYSTHPRLHYVTYRAMQEGRLVGLLIARPDPVEAVIVDYCGPVQHTEIKAALIDAAVSDLSRRGTQRIRCETSDGAIIAALWRAGFRETTAHFRFRVWSNRKDDRNRADGWFLMAGDSDNDIAALGHAWANEVPSPRSAVSSQRGGLPSQR